MLAGILIALLPPAGLVMLLRLYHIDVPFLDEWEYMLILPKSYEGTLSLADLFALHNEHRLFFPRLIMLGLARLTHWNMLYETGAAVVFAAGAFGLLVLQLHATGREVGRNLLVAAPVLSLVHFSLSQWQNWFMPCQFLMFLNLLAVIGTVVALSWPMLGWAHLAGGILLGVMASYSFANGLSVWPIGLLCLAAATEGRRRWAYAAIWCCAGAIVVAVYFYGYKSPSYHPSPWLTLHEPLAFALYILQYLGAPVVDYDGFGAAAVGAVGLAILLVCSYVLIPRMGVRALAPYWGLAFYAICGAATTGLGRLGFGIDQATSSRYITVGNLLWVCDAVLLFLALRGVRGKVVASAAAVVFILLASVNSVYGTLKWTERYVFRLPARAELISGGTNEDLLQRLHPNPQIVIERREILKKYRLGVFRE
ncbi:MAG TPA: hypothetical protein VMZ06_01315 [Candidatus Bathyarchaeia archaeon]|nr:hypothetical protein [Candidatus Bathyarchaeia archaeon]